jgi:hypothetical protein
LAISETFTLKKRYCRHWKIGSDQLLDEVNSLTNRQIAILDQKGNQICHAVHLTEILSHPAPPLLNPAIHFVHESIRWTDPLAIRGKTLARSNLGTTNLWPCLKSSVTVIATLTASSFQTVQFPVSPLITHRRSLLQDKARLQIGLY